MAITDTLDPAFHKLINEVRIDFLKETGYELSVVECTRTMKRQHGLYIQPHDGIDNDGDGKIDEADEKVTKADAGQSAHNFAEGCDCAPLLKPGVVWWQAPRSLWNMYGKIAKQHGLVWGGDWEFTDLPHVETKTWKEKRAAWKRGDIKVA